MAVCLLLFGQEKAHAQREGPTLSSVTVQGAPAGLDVRSLAAPYLSRPIGREELKTLADAVTAACQSHGLFLCRAEIPRQDFEGGVLAIALSEGHVTEIVLPPSLEPLRGKLFGAVLAEKPLTTDTFNRTLANLEEIPGLTVSAVVPVRIEGRAYRLVVDAEYVRTGLRLVASNRGSRRANPWKAVVGVERRSLLAKGDELAATYLSRPQSAGELHFGDIRYSTAPLGSGLKGLVEAQISDSSPRSELQGRDVEGSYARLAMGVETPVLRRRGLRIDASLIAETSRATETEDGARLLEDDLRVLRAKLSLRKRMGERGLLFMRTTLSQGIDMAGASGNSRADGTTDFTTLAGEMRGRGAGPFGTAMTVGLRAQRASGPLLFSEEFAFGGGAYGRGYDFGDVIGDHAAAGFVEVGRPVDIGAVRAEPYLFADAGTVWNEGQGLTGDGRVLFSAGGGLRVTTPLGISLSYEAANPLSDAPFTDRDDHVRHRIDLGFSR